METYCYYFRNILQVLMPFKTSGVTHTLTVNVTRTAAVAIGKSHATCSTVNASNITKNRCAVVKAPKAIAVCCP